MGKKKKRAKAGEVNKAAEVRAYMATHPQAKEKEIREALAKRGIKIAPNYATVVKSQMKAKKQRRAGKRGPGRPPGRTKRVSRVGRPPQRVAAGDLDVDRLAAAADFAQLCGGTDNAIEALEAAQSIYEAMSQTE